MVEPGAGGTVAAARWRMAVADGGGQGVEATNKGAGNGKSTVPTPLGAILRKRSDREPEPETTIPILLAETSRESYRGSAIDRGR